MAEYRDGKKENMIVTLILWCILCGVSMAVMLVAARGKTIVIADAGQEQSQMSEAESEPISVPSAELVLWRDENMTQQLCIPLEEGIKAENVVMENRYVDKELWIYIQQAQSLFYNENPITGDISIVKECRYELQEKHTILKFKMSEVMEYRSTLEDGRLKITFSRPSELYDQIVVVDPAGGGREAGIVAGDYAEKEFTYQVAKLLQQKLNEPGIKLYFTRTEDVEVTAEKRLQLSEAVDADLYLRLGASENQEDVEEYGIQAFYNADYFIPEFGNVQWADMVTRKVTIAAGNRAIGLVAAEENSILQELKIPAAQIQLGFMTNPRECYLMQQENYREKLAQGIAEAILEVYTNRIK